MARENMTYKLLLVVGWKEDEKQKFCGMFFLFPINTFLSNQSNRRSRLGARSPFNRYFEAVLLKWVLSENLLVFRSCRRLTGLIISFTFYPLIQLTVLIFFLLFCYIPHFSSYFFYLLLLLFLSIFIPTFLVVFPSSNFMSSVAHWLVFMLILFLILITPLVFALTTII